MLHYESSTFYPHSFIHVNKAFFLGFFQMKINDIKMEEKERERQASTSGSITVYEKATTVRE